MMRGIRRLIVCAAVSGLLAAGAIGASTQAAHADGTVTTCFAAGNTNTPYKCVLQGTISDPATVTVTVTDTSSSAYDNVTVNWTVQCTDNASGTLGTAGAPAASPTPYTLGLTLPTNAADSKCTVSATVSVSPPYSGSQPAGCVTPTAPAPTASPTSTAAPTPVCDTEFKGVLSYTSAGGASPSPTPSSTSTSPSSSVHPVKGYGGKCLDDRGNSSSNGAAVVIWSCGGSDQAENWGYSSSELTHNGKCLNDKGNGGSGSKVILYRCDGGSNEKWSHLANGELKLQAHNGTLCLDDPRNSTSNGTQLIVYTCKASPNQKWSLP
jgi:hypothetical protein